MEMQMLTEGPIKTRRDGAILEVTLDAPKANAISLKTSRVMGLAFRAFRDDDSLRVCILRAAGEKFFCPGWDLARLLESGPPLVYAAIKEVVREAENMRFQDALNRVSKRLLPTVDKLYSSEDQLEGARAFAEKRDPVWKGK